MRPIWITGYGDTHQRSQSMYVLFMPLSDDDNIAQEPKKFIQVIASLSLLKPEQLGWDPTMRLYLPGRTPSFIHSYDPSVTIEDYRETAYNTRWAIDMPSRDGKSRETFITVRALSIARAEVMCGRGTLVWHVVKHGDQGEGKVSSIAAAYPE
jgi:hypothetical protein